MLETVLGVEDQRAVRGIGHSMFGVIIDAGCWWWTIKSCINLSQMLGHGCRLPRTGKSARRPTSGLLRCGTSKKSYQFSVGMADVLLTPSGRDARRETRCTASKRPLALYSGRLVS